MATWRPIHAFGTNTRPEEPAPFTTFSIISSPWRVIWDGTFMVV